MTRFHQCLAFTLTQEGGFVHHPADPGGATNQGVTLHTLSEYMGRACTVAELRAMSPALRDGIYLTHYWRTVSGDALPVGVNLMVFDFGVTAGPETSVLLMQEAAGVEADGHIGPRTLAAVRAAKPSALIGSLWFGQVHHYRSLPSYPIFGDGWETRSDRRKMAAFAAAAQLGEIAA